MTAQGLEAFLAARPEWASAVTWILKHEATPIYAIQPVGPYADKMYEVIRQTFKEQYESNEKDRVEQVAIPGVIGGDVSLLNGQKVPVIFPDPRGILSWSVSRLVELVVDTARKTKKGERAPAASDLVTPAVTNFLHRIYYDYSNLGLAPQERAMNYAVTNAFQVTRVFERALGNHTRLSSIETQRSPICRPGSDCWDVKLTFFNPSQRLEQANHVYKFTVDVSDVLPVSVGEIRDWEVH
jgi:cyanobactin maturation PatA/PatG family protease